MVGKPIQFTNQDSDSKPTITLPQDEVQKLMDTLWELGYRPKNQTDDLSGKEMHINDLRTIVHMLLTRNCV